MFQITLMLILLFASGCAATGNPVLGETMTISPGWSQLKQTANQALRDPNVWATLLAAALLQVGNVDEKISDQLRENTPLFGSTQSADNASDDLQSLTALAYLSTALLAPGPESTGDWLIIKTKVMGSEWLAVKSASSITSGLKSLSARERPNGENDRSFPSGHATTASTQAQMAKLNVRYLPVETSYKRALGLTFDGIAALTAWARVEAGKHYPSDVLAGWAVGNFVSRLAQDFIDPDQQQLSVMPRLTNGGSGIQLVIRF